MLTTLRLLVWNCDHCTRVQLVAPGEHMYVNIHTYLYLEDHFNVILVHAPCTS